LAIQKQTLRFGSVTGRCSRQLLSRVHACSLDQASEKRKTAMTTKTSHSMKLTRFIPGFCSVPRLSRICLTSISISLLFTTAHELDAAEDAPRRVVLYVASGTFGNQGTLYTVDPTTGTVLTTVGLLHDSANNPYGLTGLKYHPTTGIFYGATSGQSPTKPAWLAIIDPATALVTPIGPFGDRSLTDLAIDPITGIMYGISGFDQKFYTINTSTGQAVQTGSTGIGFANGGGFASAQIGGSGFVCGFSNFSFYSFNKTDGTATLIGATGLRNLVKAADFNTNNVLYALEGGGGIDNTHFRWLNTCNVTTGACTRVGQITANDLDALAFIPVRR
jgi:hypothetical protein